MNRETITNGVKFVGSFCTGAAVSMLIRQNIVPKNLYEKIIISVGAFVLNNMINLKAEEYLDSSLNRIFDSLDTIKEITEETDDRDSN